MSTYEMARLYAFWLGWLTREVLIGWTYIVVMSHFIDWLW